jgi:HD-GYP domain-containing protein (c-di-GMP phosphodiesterase class II)
LGNIKKVKADELRIGMFVNLSGGWLKHPFVRNSFKIASQGEIREIIKSGFKEIEVDLSRSDLASDEGEMELPVGTTHGITPDDAPADPRESGKVPDKWNPDTLVPEELVCALNDKKMAPSEKSKVVYQQTCKMMERLFESPSAENIHVSKKVISSVTDMILSEQDTTSNLLRITSHDYYTYTHSVNVGVMAILLAKSLFRNSDHHDLHELGAGFFLHDLGKVNVDPAIINKPGRLTDQEMGRMRTHPYQGYKILQSADALTEECKYIVLQHHELFNGTGYPKRLKGDEIHIYGKICCIADIFDALTSERSYKKGLNSYDALKLMKEKMLGHFQHDLFDAFVLLFH